MKASLRPALLLCAALALLLAGCDGCEKKKEEIVEPQAGPVVATPQEQLTEAITAVATNCEVSFINRISDCQGPGVSEMEQIFDDHGAEVLSAAIQALGHKDNPKIRHTAAYLLDKKGPKLWEAMKAAKKTPNPTDMDLFWGKIQTQGVRQGRLLHDVAPVFLEGATLAGRGDLVDAFFAHFSTDKDMAYQNVRAQGLKGLMKYGRMAYFDRIKEAAQSEVVASQRFAFAAPLSMENWTPEESKTICTWATENLERDDSELRTGPIQLLTKCGDQKTWRLALLKEADRRLEAKAYTAPTVTAVRLLCAKHLSEDTGPEAVCTEANAHLRRAIENKDALMPLRLFSISNLAETWHTPDDIAYVTALTKSSEKEIAARAALVLPNMSLQRESEERARIMKEQGIVPRSEFDDPPEDEKKAPALPTPPTPAP